VTFAILDPFSGIAGDMTLGALIGVGLEADWLRALPAALGLDGVVVRIEEVRRGGIACHKVEFEIPPQPHGRHLKAIRAMVDAAPAPPEVKRTAEAAFTAIATVEARMHGTTIERVHLHEVGAVDAILDVVGAVWGLARLGVREVYSMPVALGDGSVVAAHGTLPVPAPATLALLEGHPVRPGPAGAGELVTPTGAALLTVLSRGRPPREYVPRRTGYGAGTKDFADRPNALRIVLATAVDADGDGADGRETLVTLSADIDDMPGEYLAAAVEGLRASGALDVVVIPTQMKKGRPGMRVEVLASPQTADALEARLFADTTTIGVRRTRVDRRALAREARMVTVRGHDVRVKVTQLPGGGTRTKPESDDVRRVALATAAPVEDIFAEAVRAAERRPTAQGS
jgi:pyridinium-3,5-bisthiocarboxylic acid mononucleotide nickel chelatase